MRGRSGEPYTRDNAGRYYVTPAYFELAYGRDLRTVRDWARLGKVRSMWHDDTLYVHLTDCRMMDQATPKQPRANKEAS